MFALIADLMRGWGLPWSGAGFLIVAALLLFIILRVSLYLFLYFSYLLVCAIRWANLQPPGLIYAAEIGIYRIRARLKAVLWLSFLLVGAWTWLYLDRANLESERLVGIERKITSVVTTWVGS
jgi:hypothetical protein